jgi:adenosylmethionine-8-amino-7-oxononanoate aminotransferase
MPYSEERYHRLQQDARDHLWMHFTRHAPFAERDVPIIVRGDGAYIVDAKGRRYLDALSGLFVVQAGHGRDESSSPSGWRARLPAT